MVTEAQPAPCRAYGFVINNGDGTRSVCMGCDNLPTGTCCQRRMPVIGKVNFKEDDPELPIRINKMHGLAQKLRRICGIS